MSGNSEITRLPEFVENMDFEIFSEKLDQYFVASEIAGDSPRRVAILLTTICNATYKLLQDLCFPSKPKDKKYQELVELLTGQLQKKRSVFAERYKFHQAKQSSSETIQEWTARLKGLSAYCKFGSVLEMMLRDRFIVGLENRDIVNRLFRESEALLFTQAVEIAEQIEVAKLHTQEIREEENSAQKVHQLSHPNKDYRKQGTEAVYRRTEELHGVRKTQGGTDARTTRTGSNKCYTCGYDRHLAKNCRYNTYRCRKCHKIGHLARVCTDSSKNTNTDNHCHWNAEESNQEQEEHLFNIRVGYNKPITVKVNIDNVPLIMEVDSGSGVSTMSEDMYKSKFSEYELQDCNIVLVNYTQGRHRPQGIFQPCIMYKGVKIKANIIVVKNGGPPLLGRDLMKAFKIGLTNIHNLVIRDTAESMISEFKDVFSEGMGTYKHGKVSLKLKANSTPIFFKPRLLPFVLKEAVDKELTRLEEMGMIEHIDFSDWGTPLVPVVKKDGGIRICADYKVTLNKYLEEVKYPLPRIEEIFNKLGEGQEFSKLDMSEAYNQLLLDDESRKVSTWSTHRGLYQVNRLPFGVAPAAAKFQKMLEQLLMGLEGVVNFLDDIVVTGKNRAEHAERLRRVLERLQKAGLKLKQKKCELFQAEIKYLGYIINKEGLRKDPVKVKAMLEAVRPTSVTQVRSFVGMVNYYGKFIPHMATVLKPLYELLSKDNKFQWSSECEEAFIHIKDLLGSDQVLAHYSPEWPIKLACDASNEGVGAVLSQMTREGVERPIAYAARTLSKAERGYSMVEKEALAIYFAVKHFHQYLYGKTFTLTTDHKPLVTIFGEHKEIPQMSAARLQRWAVFLSGYQYKIEYIKGKNNFSADFLSRSTNGNDIQETELPEYGYMHFIESQYKSPVDSTVIKKASRKDITLSKVMQFIDFGWPETVQDECKPYHIRSAELTIDQGCAMWGHRVIVPYALQGRMLEELHGTHAGVVKMKSTARSFMWWPGLDKQIEEIVKKCTACVSNRQEPEKALLIPWQRPTSTWKRIHVDYLGPIKNKMYLIVIDAFSKWPEVLDVERADAEQTLHKLRELFARFGLPMHIVTDNGTTFTAEIFKEFLNKNGISHSLTAPGHPATNGLAENGVKSFKGGLYKALKDNKNSKVKTQTLIARYLMYYRNAIHCTTLETPAKLMFGRQLRTRLSLILPINNPVVESQQDRQTRYHKGKRDTIMKPGERVMVRDYSMANKRTWAEATITKDLGPRTYLCTLSDGRVWRRHLDQIQGGLEIEAEGRHTHTTTRERETISRKPPVVEKEDKPPKKGDGGDIEEIDKVTQLTGNKEKEIELENRQLRKSGRITRPPERLGEWS